MSIPAKIRAALHERAGSRCEICSKPANNAHHRRNQSQGGPDVLSNLMLLCGSGTTGCHGRVTMHPKWAADNGYTIRGRVASPESVPVWIRGERCQLADDGTVTPIPGVEVSCPKCPQLGTEFYPDEDEAQAFVRRHHALVGHRAVITERPAA